MSRDAVVKLLQASEADEALRNELDTADRPEAVVAVGAEHGFVFTAQELEKALEEIRKSVPEKLSDDELERVAGGIGDIKGELLGVKELTLQTGPGMVKRGGFLGTALGGFRGYDKLL